MAYLSLVLHWHLPYVRHPEQPRVLEEDWFFEALSETYLPLLASWARLEADRVPFRLTVSVSPTLAEMFRDEFLQGRYVQFLDRQVELCQREIIRTRREAAANKLARMYLRRYEECRQQFEEVHRRNLLSSLLHFQQQGYVDLITSSATHAFLPAFQSVPSVVRAQLAVAVRSHVRHFGVYPKGLWLPECGYYPGLEAYCRELDLGYFFVESHGLLFADSRPRHGVYAPLYCPNMVAAFGRDPESARAVWSSEEGYPGDPAYREFYRDIGFDLPLDYLRPFLPEEGVRVNTGIKYHAITGKGATKRLYNPDPARRKAQEHAEHFLASRLQQVERLATLMDRPPILVCPFDAELFGHWWFEGPEWLETLLRRLPAAKGKLVAVTPGEYLAEQPVQQIAQPCFSSWGNKGYAEVWLDGSNDWLYRYLHEQAGRMTDLLRRFPAERGIRRRTLNQAFREMLLSEASDWAFIMKTGTTVPYAVRRAKEHISNFTRLCDSVIANSTEQEWLLQLEARHSIFPEIDYRSFQAEP